MNEDDKSAPDIDGEGPVDPAAAAADESAQALHRDVTTLMATVDQHSAELDAINVEQMVLVFALGALAGVLFLQHREIKGLARALAG